MQATIEMPARQKVSSGFFIFRIWDGGKKRNDAENKTTYFKQVVFQKRININPGLCSPITNYLFYNWNYKKNGLKYLKLRVNT